MKKTDIEIMINQSQKHKGLISLLVWMSMLQFSGPSFASPLLMGNIISVHPYGAQDAIRSPALLVWQRQDNTIGLLSNYRSNISTSFHTLNTDNIQNSNLINNIGTSRLSYINKTNILAFGCDIYADYNMSRNRLQIYSQPGGLGALNQGLVDTESFLTALTISAGLALNSHHSLGIQLSTSYFKSSEKTKIKSGIFLPFPPFLSIGYLSNTETMQQITTTPGIGYLGKIENSEIGLLFNGGRLTWEKDSSKKLQINSFFANSNLSANGKLPFSFTYNVGPGLIAGSFSKITDMVNVGLELEITFPVEYKNQFLDQVGKTYPTSIFVNSSKLRLEEKISNHPSIGVRGGFELLTSSNTVLSFGGGLGFNNTENHTLGGLLPPTTRNQQIYRKILSVYGTAGFDFLLGKYNVITVGTVLSYNTISNEENRFQQEDLNGPILHRANTKIKALTIDAVVALSFGF
jgi:hypothetical protein